MKSLIFNNLLYGYFLILKYRRNKNFQLDGGIEILSKHIVNNIEYFPISSLGILNIIESKQIEIEF